MWDHLPLDLLSHIFSFLSPDSLARAMSACRHWHTCARTCPTIITRGSSPNRHPPWFLAMHARSQDRTCYAHNPTLGRWHSLPLDFVPHHLRLLAAVGSLLLCKLAASSSLRLVLLNPFTRQHKPLPALTTPRSNPAVAVVSSSAVSFRVYVAGGASGASYEPTVEMYDSRDDAWSEVGPMPVEYAVRLTVWTPNESVWAGGTVYWMTSARAYSVVGFEVGGHVWREVKVPMADRLEWAALVGRWTGRVGLVGGTCEGEGCVWELSDGDEWVLVGVVPRHLGRRFMGSKASWGSTRCVGSDEALYLFRDLDSEMLVWKKKKKKKNKWEWSWVEGCSSPPSIPIRGVLLHPSLSPSDLGFYSS